MFIYVFSELDEPDDHSVALDPDNFPTEDFLRKILDGEAHIIHRIELDSMQSEFLDGLYLFGKAIEENAPYDMGDLLTKVWNCGRTGTTVQFEKRNQLFIDAVNQLERLYRYSGSKRSTLKGILGKVQREGSRFKK